jgi:DNA-binding response OmpR family regulator
MEEFCVKPWLVVEDEEDIRNIVKVMFTAWGHTSIDFRDGNQTYAWLDKVEAGAFQGELPELALLDIKMPGPRGNEIARRMRAFEPFKTIPIILMTAFTLEDQERQSMVRDDGVDYIINKPLPDFFELKKQLEEIFEKKKARVATVQTKAANGDVTVAAGANANQAKVAEVEVAHAANTDSEENADTSAIQAKVANGEVAHAANTDSEINADTSDKSAND